jgi:2-C-methyl-D-erythritol 2,4-cyclodiphosphate synthase
MKIRVGFGYDVHPFAENRDLYLGGIKVPYHKGLAGHSDADVLIHAICDALLGAAGARDIGYHFPDTDNEYKNIDSTILLTKTMQIIRDRGYDLNNLDLTVCAEKPKINPFIIDMQNRLAQVMSVDPCDISIKATTSEKMGFVGREEGIAVFATVLIITKEE